ncbi:MAG: hypothetical protein ACOYWZ_09545 [Bacillota bacterium]
MINKRKYYIENFIGGINREVSPFKLRPEQCYNAENVFSKDGSLEVLKGTSDRTSSITLTDTFTKAHYYKEGEIILQNGSKVYLISTTAETDITNATHTPSTVFGYSAILNDKFILTREGKPLVYDPTSSSITFEISDTNCPPAIYCESFENIMFLGNDITGNLQSRIYYSAFRDPTTWDVSFYIDIAEDKGGKITGLKKFGNYLVIFKSNGIFTGQFSGDVELPLTLSAVSNIGCKGGDSIVVYEDILFFQGFDGIYQMDYSFNPIKISEPIRPFLEAMI